MKPKLILAVLLAVGISGCKEEPSTKPEVISHFTVVVADSCQYIYLPGKYGFSHKGNCDNPIHRNGGN